MHISDGILDIEVTLPITIATVVIFYFCYRKITIQDLPLIAVGSAMFFVASFVHIPVGVTQIHLSLIGIIGVLLGLSSFIAIFIALILQALFLGYGGVSSLGVNLFIMGVPAILTFYIFNADIFKKLNEKVGFFLVGFLGVFFATLFLTTFLYFAKDEYSYALLTIFGVNIVGMVIEGVVTLFLLLFLKKAYPQILRRKEI